MSVVNRLIQLVYLLNRYRIGWCRLTVVGMMITLFRSNSSFFTSVEFVDLIELFLLGEGPVIVYVVVLLRRNVYWWVFIVKLLLSLFAIELRQSRWLLVSFFFLVFRSSFLTIVLLSDTLLLLLPLIVGLNVFLVSIVELHFLV